MHRFPKAILICLALAWAAPALAEPVRVLAASSLKTALDGVIGAYESETGKQAQAIYAATSALAKQIEEGAPADLFISADETWMDTVADKQLIRVETRIDLLGNTLVLVVPAESTASFAPTPGSSIDPILNGGRLAVAQTEAVPAGKYAKAALQSLGLWDRVKDHLAEAENVRAALLLVERGEAAAGIVYGSDAKSDTKVKAIAEFPAASHPPIRYPAAVVAASGNMDAAAFLAYLQSDKASGIFTDNGFSILK